MTPTELVGRHLDDLDGARCRAHAAANGRALERRTGGAAVATSRSLLPNTTSQFVPMSKNSRRRESRSMPDARVGHDVAAHVGAEGGEHTSACSSPSRNLAARSPEELRDMMKGDPRGSGSIPRTMCHGGVARDGHSYTSSGETPPFTHACAIRRAPRGEAGELLERLWVHHDRADAWMTSRRRALLVEHDCTATGMPLVRSSGDTRTISYAFDRRRHVVVRPATSRAMPVAVQSCSTSNALRRGRHHTITRS